MTTTHMNWGWPGPKGGRRFPYRRLASVWKPTPTHGQISGNGLWGRSARRSTRAFSLLEVIIAVGVFAASVTVVIALLPALTRQGARVQDSLAAQRLTDALRVELRRVAAIEGLDALAAAAPVMPDSSDAGLAFVATRDAGRLHALNHQPPATATIPLPEQYFLVECWRFPDEPLRFDAQKQFLAVAVRVSWPYRIPGAAMPTESPTRTQANFTVSLTR